MPGGYPAGGRGASCKDVWWALSPVPDPLESLVLTDPSEGKLHPGRVRAARRRRDEGWRWWRRCPSSVAGVRGWPGGESGGGGSGHPKRKDRRLQSCSAPRALFPSPGLPRLLLPRAARRGGGEQARGREGEQRKQGGGKGCARGDGDDHRELGREGRSIAVGYRFPLEDLRNEPVGLAPITCHSILPPSRPFLRIFLQWLWRGVPTLGCGCSFSKPPRVLSLEAAETQLCSPGLWHLCAHT